ncbi:MAG: hypothetical protein ACK5QC_09540 [Bacteroidota bacterium]
MRKTRSLIILFLLCINLNAQPPRKFYCKYGGNGVDIGYGVKQCLDTNYIIIGSTTSFGAGSSDIYLLKIDSMGQFMWQKTFGGFNQDVGKSIALLPDGGFVITGYSSSYGAGGYDVITIRTDKFGNQLWLKSFGGLDWDFGNDVIIGPDGNIIVCGSTYSYGYGNRDGLVLKYDLNGNLLWHKTFGGNLDDEFVSMSKSSNGNTYLGGNTKSYGDTKGDFWMFAVNNLGDSITSSNLGKANTQEYCYDMLINTSNELILCGSVNTSTNSSITNNCYSTKRNINGNFISEVIYSGAGDNDKYLSIARQHNGSDLMFSRSVLKPGFSIEVQPLLADLNMNWINSTTYVTNEIDEAYDVTSTHDNGYALLGYTMGYSGNLTEDIFFVKVDNGLVGSTNIVGINETAALESSSLFNPFFNTNKINFNNTAKSEISFTLLNQIGQTILKGNTTQNFIEINSELTRGIYYLILNTSSHKIIIE